MVEPPKSDERGILPRNRRESEELLRILTEFASDCIYWRSPEGKMLYISPACVQLTGYTPEEFYASPGLLDILVHPDDRASWREHDHDARADGSPRPIKHRIVRKDGETRWVSHVCRSAYDHAGVFLGIRGSNRDITAEKEAEEAHRLDEARLEALVKLNEMAAAPVGEVADFVLDQAVKLTRSQMGFLGFISDDESALIIHAYSEGVMRECAVADKPKVFPIAESGLWGEAVRQRKPIIVNDYATLADAKQGYPVGHVNVSRFLAVPVIEGGRVVAVTAVGNKVDEYQAGDVRQLTLLSAGMWQHIQQQREQAELQANEERLATAQRVARLGFWDWNIVTNELYWSDEIYHIFGLTPVQFGATYAAFLEMVHPDDRRYVEQKVDATVHHNAEYSIDHRIVLPGGEVRYVHEQGEVERDAHGAPLRMVGTVTDITDRAQAEQARRKQHGLLQAIIEGTNDAIFLKDLDGRYLMVNSAAAGVFGRPIDDVVGKDDAQLLSSESVEELRRVDRRIVATGEALSVEESITVGGAKRTYFSTKAPYRDGEGNIIGVIGISRDVSDQRRLEEEILKISRLEQHRIGQDLHDAVGQHLTGVAFLAKVLEKRLLDQSLPEAAKASQIAQLINETIVQTRAIARGLCPVDLAADGLLNALREYAGHVETLFDVVCHFQCDKPILLHDDTAATHLYRIAQEAVNNAVKHGRPRRIDLAMDGDDGCLTLTVRDDGVGLPDHCNERDGMGLHIMDYRAKMIGATLDVRRGSEGGTVVECLFSSDTITTGESIP